MREREGGETERGREGVERGRYKEGDNERGRQVQKGRGRRMERGGFSLKRSN
jgi:hypothetical protein